MADRLLYIGWGEVVPGREEHAIEVFNDVVGLYGRMQQDGRIEKFNVVLLEPHAGLNGYIELQGSAQQLAALKEEDDFQRALADCALVVEDLNLVGGFVNEGIAHQMALYQQAVTAVPQTT
jgi:hypothetical protein